MFHRACFATVVAVWLFTFPLIGTGQTIQDRPLHQAAEQNDAARVSQLLAEGVPIDARDGSGATALLAATHANAVDAAKVLIQAGSDVNAKDNIHDSPYLYAGARGHWDILTMTLQHGADLKSTNRYGGTALIPAAERGHVKTVATLLEAGVDVDHVNNLHWTALLEAIVLGDGSERYRHIVELLVKAGADVNLADGNGVTPLQHARRANYHDIEKMLLDAGGR